MTIEDVKSFIADNKESADVQTFVKELSGTINIDTVKEYLTNNEDGKKFINSLTDSKIAKGIETWKTNNLQKIIDEEISKVNPKESEEAKMIRELKAKIEATEREAKREKLLNKALAVATEKGLPVKIIDRFLGDDDETTLSNLTELETIFKEALGKEVENKFKDNGRSPSVNTDGKQFTISDLETMSREDLIKYKNQIKL